MKTLTTMTPVNIMLRIPFRVLSLLIPRGIMPNHIMIATISSWLCAAIIASSDPVIAALCTICGITLRCLCGFIIRKNSSLQEFQMMIVDSSWVILASILLLILGLSGITLVVWILTLQILMHYKYSYSQIGCYDQYWLLDSDLQISIAALMYCHIDLSKLYGNILVPISALCYNIYHNREQWNHYCSYDILILLGAYLPIALVSVNTWAALSVFEIWTISIVVVYKRLHAKDTINNNNFNYAGLPLLMAYGSRLYYPLLIGVIILRIAGTVGTLKYCNSEINTVCKVP
jgi:hypothetical protein